MFIILFQNKTIETNNVQNNETRLKTIYIEWLQSIKFEKEMSNEPKSFLNFYHLRKLLK
jgi:hypothetical protein